MRDQPNPPAPQPSNRAARRARKTPDTVPTHHRGTSASARPAQGRRVNPVRRTA